MYKFSTLVLIFSQISLIFTANSCMLNSFGLGCDKEATPNKCCQSLVEGVDGSNPNSNATMEMCCWGPSSTKGTGEWVCTDMNSIQLSEEVVTKGYSCSSAI